MSLDKVCIDKTVNEWDGLYNCYDELFQKDPGTSWVFRGDDSCPSNESVQSSLEKCLRSSLDKEFYNFGIDVFKERTKIENGLRREFRRKAPSHINEKFANYLECLALLQHHGGPTRMLDWTYSFFLAVYFAINRTLRDIRNPESEKGSCVVWAINNNWLSEKNIKLEDDYLESNPYKLPKGIVKMLKGQRANELQNYIVNYLLKKNPKGIVYACRPYYLKERLSIQRGVLLCAGNIGETWGENLKEMISGDNENYSQPIILRINIEWAEIQKRKKILNWLFEMNITQASLFPGLDGFAQSLRTRIAHPKSLGI